MKRLLTWSLLLATALFAACGGGDEPTDEPNIPDNGALGVQISGIVANYNTASIKIKTTGAAANYAYVAEPSPYSGESYSAEQLFAVGTTGKCSGNATTFTVNELVDSTPYTLFVAVKSAEGELSEVASADLTTKTLPEYAVTAKRMTGFNASVRLPKALAEGNVVKWAITDLAYYNYHGGEGSEERWLNRNESIYGNYFTSRYDFVISEDTRTFTKDGVTYSHYEPIIPGQPVVLLMGEYGAGTHPEWGEGHYSPLFGSANPSGYFRKETIVTTKPSLHTSAPSITVDIRPSGKGNIVIAPATGAVRNHYLLLTNEQYTQALTLLDGHTSYLQWFVCSAFAAEHFGAKSITSTVALDTATLNLNADETYHILICSWADEQGSKQSFAESTFCLPPSAPLPTDNTIIAHRGGSKEAGTGSTPDNSIASLKYAMSLGCYASEADIYWTKDNKIVVAHADSNCKINGLYPWESTLAQLQAAGKLANGETLPSLEDYIRAVMVKGSKTKLCLDVKAITKPTTHDTEAVKSCERACEIIKEMEAENFCEFICSGRANITKNCAKYANAIGVPIGAMGDFTPSQYKSYGYTWHNRDKGYGITADEINSYLSAGLEVSVFTLDTDAEWASIEPFYTKLRGITTNYPSKMLSKLR